MRAQIARRSDRIYITMPLEVTGKDIEGREFVQQARTLMINRRGATVVLAQKLAANQELSIRPLGAHRQEVVRVVRQKGRHADGTVYWVLSLNPNINLWDIEFPPSAESDQAFAHALLECGRCQSRGVVCLNEIEFKAFVADQALARYCKACDASTTWKPVSSETLTGQRLPPAPRPRTVDERKEVRAKVSLLACIRQSGHDEEVVVCENISHGGLCFRSKRRYRKGTKIEIAVPYSPRAASVFVFAWIVYSRELPKGDIFRHGVVYRMPKPPLNNGHSE